MKPPRLPDSRRRSDRQAADSRQRGAKLPTEEPKRVEELSKPNGVRKAKDKKTRRGKRGGVRRRMQIQERMFLEAIIEERLRDIRYSMEALQTRPSYDVTIDGISLDLAEMSIDSSDDERLYDYEHYWPEQLNDIPVNNTHQNRNNGYVIQDQYDGYDSTGYAESTGYARYDHVEYSTPGYYEYEHTGYGYDYGYAGYGYDNGYYGYVHVQNEYG